MSDEIFDFGFSTVDVEELKKGDRIALETANQRLSDTHRKLMGLKSMIWPLLLKLKEDPTSDYIHWPNKAIRITEFMDRIEKYIKDES